MKNVDISKSNYILDNTNVFIVNDNAKLTASGTEETAAHVYSQSHHAEVVCFEDSAQIYGDSSEVIYENPTEFNPTVNNKFVTFGESAVICPGNKSVNCAFGDATIFYTGYELLESQGLVPENRSYEKYKFLEDSICFSSGENSTIYTSPVEYCVINAQLITAGEDANVFDYSPASNNIILSTGNNNSIESNGCRAVLATGNNLYASIHNAALSAEINTLVEKQEVVCLGKESRVSTDNKSTIIVKDDAQWIQAGQNSVLAIMTMTNSRPDILLFYTQDEEGEYPTNIADSQKIYAGSYYRLNENKELVKVDNPNHRP